MKIHRKSIKNQLKTDGKSIANALKIHTHRKSIANAWKIHGKYMEHT